MQSIRMTRSGRKHRVGFAHAVAAIKAAGEPVVDGDALVYVGSDDRGVELEIVIVPDNKNEDGWVIIHAMPTSFRQ